MEIVHGLCLLLPASGNLVYNMTDALITTIYSFWSQHIFQTRFSKVIAVKANHSLSIVHYTPNGYIVPMEFRVHIFPRISAFSRRTKMHLNGMFLIGTEFFRIISPL